MKQIIHIVSWLIASLLVLVAFLLFIKTGDNEGTISNFDQNDHHKKVTILTYANWNPFEYIQNGKVVGFDIDLIEKLSDEANFQYSIKNVSWDAMFTQLQGKQADVAISGVTMTKDRQKTFSFSNPYFESKQSIVTKLDAPIKRASDLAGHNVVVQNGSTGQAAAQTLFGKHNPHILKSASGVSYQMVIQGQALAYIGDETSNQKFIQANPKERLKIVEDPKAFPVEHFGIMFPKDSGLTRDYNRALRKIIRNGEYAQIYHKWFGVKPNVKTLIKEQR